jgi:hypothetical protein
MKYTILGIICFIVAVGFAGNWIYSPASAEYEPIPHYPDGDPANNVFSSELTYIPSKDMYYQEWNYVWLNASGHTPDTEEIRIYFKDGMVHHVELRIHYEWMEITDFRTDGNHVHIYFKSVYHTTYTTDTTTTIHSFIERKTEFQQSSKYTI